MKPITIEPRRIDIGPLHAWSLELGLLTMPILTAAFVYLSYTERPTPAFILGAVLADYIILAHRHWLLRALIAWVMADVIYCALIGNIGAL